MAVTTPTQERHAQAQKALSEATQRKDTVDRKHADIRSTLANLREQREALQEHGRRLSAERFATGEDGGYAAFTKKLAALDATIAEHEQLEAAALHAHEVTSAQHAAAAQAYETHRRALQAEGFSERVEQIIDHLKAINVLWPLAATEARRLEAAGNGQPLTRLGNLRWRILHGGGDGPLTLSLPEDET